MTTWSNTSIWSYPICSTARAKRATAPGPSRYATLGNSTLSFTGRSKRSVAGRADAFEDHLTEHAGVTEPPNGVKDLDTCQLSLGVVVRRDAFAEVLGRDGRLPESEIQRIDLAVVGDFHWRSP